MISEELKLLTHQYFEAEEGTQREALLAEKWSVLCRHEGANEVDVAAWYRRAEAAERMTLSRKDKSTLALALLDELGLTERQLAAVRAMLDANRTGGATEYELAHGSEEITEEPKG